jgi:endonuclease YncB( thermonuclease family)
VVLRNAEGALVQLIRRGCSPNRVLRAAVSTRKATNRVDEYGRLLRCVAPARYSVSIKIRLVALWAAAAYFYDGRRDKFANRLEALAKRAKAKKLGLRGACPRTVYAPHRRVEVTVATTIERRS